MFLHLTATPPDGVGTSQVIDTADNPLWESIGRMLMHPNAGPCPVTMICTDGSVWTYALPVRESHIARWVRMGYTPEYAAARYDGLT